jgi:CHASE3 domain sensor protein
MNRWSLSRSATLALIAATASLLATGWLAARELSRLLEATAWSRHALEVLVESGALGRYLATAEAASRGYVVSGSAAYRDAVESSARAIETHLARLEQLVADNARRSARCTASCWCSATSRRVAAASRRASA